MIYKIKPQTGFVCSRVFLSIFQVTPKSIPYFVPKTNLLIPRSYFNIIRYISTETAVNVKELNNSKLPSFPPNVSNFIFRYINVIHQISETPWLSARVPLNYWEDINNQKKYLNWLAKELNVEKLEDWYNVVLKVTLPITINSLTSNDRQLQRNQGLVYYVDIMDLLFYYFAQCIPTTNGCHGDLPLFPITTGAPMTTKLNIWNGSLANSISSQWKTGTPFLKMYVTRYPK